MVGEEQRRWLGCEPFDDSGAAGIPFKNVRLFSLMFESLHEGE
jgi:hypothetical protein